MKLLLLPLLILLHLTSLCQQKPVQWSGAVQKNSGSAYTIQLNAEIQQGWYLYAQEDAANELEGVKLVWNTEQLKRKGALLAAGTKTAIADKIFGGKQKVFKNNIAFSQEVTAAKAIPAIVMITITGYAANGKEFLPINEELELKFDGGIEAKSDLKLASVNLQQPVAHCGEKQQENDRSILAIFFLGFGGGLIALLTPCVFPMVPVTVSFFINRSANRKQGIRNGVSYGLFILLIYLLASSPFHLAGNINPQVFNAFSTNAWVNLAFFVVFLLFALSLFGVFELRLPSSVATKTDSKAGLHTLGIFFMALTLAIVSFSCTGPILGSLLVGSLSSAGGAWQLTAGMGGFGLALGLPFALFAIFPQWLQRLPKSGGWLEVVKKSLAFVELALAIKFLSNADLVEHWGILKREVFIGAWILIALGLALYLLGVFRKREPAYMRNADAPVVRQRRLSPMRVATGVLVLLFALYLTPGLTQTKYANLKLLSGFPPPLSYSVYGNDNAQGKGLEPDVINDYEKALALSRQTGKPLLIDFTGWACVNCRKMEEQVWSKPQIASLIRENFVLLSLYVDDRKQLPAAEQMAYTTSGGDVKRLRTVGDKWATFQAENFGQVTQPLYVILSPDQKLLNYPVGYTPNVAKYEQWLLCGLGARKDN